MNLSTYLKEIQKELKLTTFPSQNVVINFTIFVIVFTIMMALYLGALDLGFGEGVLQSINIFKDSAVINQVSEVATTTASTSVDVLPVSATSVPANILVK